MEFSPPGSFTPVAGYRSGGPHALKPGEWTDDTSMALALADSIAEVGWDLNDQARRYLAWFRDGRYSVNGRCFDIGNQTRRALGIFERTGNALTSGDRDESSSGNGSIMRLAPLVLAFAHWYPERADALLRRAEESSLATHPSPICRSACRYLALLLAALAHGVPREEALSPGWPLLELAGPLHPAVQEVAEGSFRLKEPPTICGSGYVVASLEAALWAFAGADDFRAAVLRAVNLGDDADTTGAVCGQLAGACWGEAGIPAEWRSGLARRDLLEKAWHRLMTRPNDAPPPRPPESSDPLDAALPERCYWIRRGAVLGGCYPGAVDETERDRKIDHLLAAGVRTFLNLTQPDEIYRGRTLADYEAAVYRLAAERGAEVRCLRFPVEDLCAPELEEMEAILAAIRQATGAGLVYVHCLGGVGRTGTVAACWLLSEGEATHANVVEQLTELRRMDRHRGQLDAPATPAQRRFVQRWAERLRAGGPGRAGP